MTDTTQAPHHRISTEPRGVADSSTVKSSAPFRGVDATSLIEKFAISSPSGGLVLLGPTAAPLDAIEGLLDGPGVEAVEVCGERLCSWITSPDEVLLTTRAVSSIIRAGHTAVVYLDSHCEGGPATVGEDNCEFVCCRLGRIMVGLADTPAFIAIHGEHMANGFLDAVGEVELDSLGFINDDLALLELSPASMFPALPVAVTTSARSAIAMSNAVDWFEARRR